MNFCRLSDPEARGARHSELAAVEGTQRNKSGQLEDAEAEQAHPGPAPPAFQHQFSGAGSQPLSHPSNRAPRLDSRDS